jgi:hypothetical protein
MAMTKFLVLYRSSLPPAHQTASATPEQMKAGMDRWNAWVARAQPAIVDLGTPLGYAVEITGTSIHRSHSLIEGYSILQAESQSALTDLLMDHPHYHSSGASIEVLEMLPLPGM